MRLILWSFLVVVCAATTPLTAQEAGRIEVSGAATVEAAPDMATVRIGVGHQAKTAAQAMDLTSEAMSAMLTRLTDLGFEARDLQTSGLSLGPIWSNRSSSSDGPEQVGFEASNQLAVRVRDMDRLGEVLDVLIREDGANRLNGISFDVQDRAPLLDQAREMAVAEARRKAELYAGAAGVDLGALIRLSDLPGGARPIDEPVMMEASMARAVPVAGGEVSVSANVTMIFAIGQ